LRKSLAEEANDFVGSDLEALIGDHGVVDVLWGDKVENQGDEGEMFDTVFAGGPVAGSDGHPNDLTERQPGAWWMKLFVQSVDAIGKEPSDCRSEGLRELRLQEVSQGAVKSFALARSIVGNAW